MRAELDHAAPTLVHTDPGELPGGTSGVRPADAAVADRIDALTRSSRG
ncbi:MAG: hypothetical protein IPF99_40970 [Deltaproteobacteria bacterium]|nr:hypothetical protein [Deltaproteobacteria bacterium]